mmetsp:Transcript_18435/g.45372  ORF Transcript_18435/g.45372 Transcript_18435/m.45372 type:complete len:221 (-) Transcript_18435:550-1212(-)
MRSNKVMSPSGSALRASVIQSPRDCNTSAVNSPSDDGESDLVVMKMLASLEAEVAALQAPAGEMPRAALQAVTMKTLTVIERTGATILAMVEDALSAFNTSHQAASEREARAEAAIGEVEAALVKAKVALVETQAQTSKAEIQLSSVKKGLAQPGLRADKKALETEARLKAAERQSEAAKSIHDSLMKRVQERREEVAKERKQIEKLRKVYQDLEGDWGA